MNPLITSCLKMTLAGSLPIELRTRRKVFGIFREPHPSRRWRSVGAVWFVIDFHLAVHQPVATQQKSLHEQRVEYHFSAC